MDEVIIVLVKPHRTSHTILSTAIMVVIGIVLLLVYYRYQAAVSPFIRHLGPLGILFSIILMAILCIVPFPAEFLMILDMQIYGVWFGILYVWLGAMLGAYITFLVAKHFGQQFARRIVGQKNLNKLSKSVHRYGSIGLLISRMIPFIPFVVLNFASAMIKEVTTWTYLWTTGIGIMPYDLGAALIFLGVSKRTIGWLIVGAIAVVVIWLVTLLARTFHKNARSRVP